MKKKERKRELGKKKLMNMANKTYSRKTVKTEK